MSKVLNSIKETFQNRNLLSSMIVKDFKGKYKSTHLGMLWHFVKPVILIILFYLVFTSIRAKPLEFYWVYLCVGIFPFMFFQENLQGGSGCVVSNGGLIKKMHFPRETLVISYVVSRLITLLITYAGLLIILIFIGYPLNPVALIFIPVVLGLSILFSLGYVFLLSSITVFVRDIQPILSSFGRVIMWTTPVVFLISEVSPVLQKIIWCNPLTYFIESYHDIIYSGVVPNTINMLVCCILTVIMLTIGLIVFNRLKGRFAEEL